MKVIVAVVVVAAKGAKPGHSPFRYGKGRSERGYGKGLRKGAKPPPNPPKRAMPQTTATATKTTITLLESHINKN